jgi:GNAT superfamily N-acetyltransferase
MTTDTFYIRRAREGDMGLVLRAWLDSFFDAHAAGPLPADVYRAAYRETIGRIVEQTATEAHVAVSPRDPDATLYGFVVAEPATRLWMLYVKQPYRGRGIARALMDTVGLERFTRFAYVFKTASAGAVSRHWPNARFDPMPARRLRRREDQP